MKSKNLFLLLLLATLWGPSFLFIKVAVAEIPPILLAALRIGFAAVLINIYLFFKDQQLTKDIKFWMHVTIAGFFAHALPFALINWGEQHIDSALASVLNGLTPLSAVILAFVMIREESLSIKMVIGVLVGFLGLIVLVLPNIMDGFQATTTGVVAVTIGAISYGIGMVYSRKYLMGAPPLHAPSAQLLATAIYLVPLSFVIDSPTVLMNVSWQAWSSVLILATFGTALAFVIYYRLLALAGVSYVSLVTYLMPIYGVVLGALFLDEQISFEMLLGMGLILIGIGLVNHRRSIVKSGITSSSAKKKLIEEPVVIVK